LLSVRVVSSESGVAQQIALYGEPLSTRFARLLSAFAIPQSRLAAIIGLSAPMLSQLASGQRVKISNPAVLARLLSLEQLAASPTARSGDTARLQQALEQVAASRPTLTTEAAVDPGGESVVPLADLATLEELERAAAAVPGTRLSAVLSAAAARRAADRR
jgi:hypothetical protein